MTLDALTAGFFLARLPRKHSPHTLDAYRHDIALIAPRLPAEVDQITVPLLRSAFAGISYLSPATIARAWSTWNQLLTFAVAEGVLPGNPMAGVGKPKLPRSRPKAIQGEDAIPRLLSAASVGRLNARDKWPERDYAVIVVLVTCGLRLAELCDLKVSSIDGPAGCADGAREARGQAVRAVGRARSMRFRPDQDPRLKRRAEELGRAEADIVREALDEKMAREGW